MTPLLFSGGSLRNILALPPALLVLLTGRISSHLFFVRSRIRLNGSRKRLIWAPIRNK